NDALTLVTPIKKTPRPSRRRPATCRIAEAVAGLCGMSRPGRRQPDREGRGATKDSRPFCGWRVAHYIPRRLPGYAAMKPSALLEQHREAIRRIVAQHRARNPRVFGSVLFGEDTDDSDLDLLVDPDEDMSLFDVGAIRWELRKLLGVTVDVVTPHALPEGFRNEILADAAPV